MPLYQMDKPLSVEEKKYAQMSLIEFLDEKFPKRHAYAISFKHYRMNEEKRRDLTRLHRNLVSRYQQQMKKKAYNPNATHVTRHKQSKVCVEDGLYEVGDSLMSKTIMGLGKVWVNASGTRVRYAYLE